MAKQNNKPSINELTELQSLTSSLVANYDKMAKSVERKNKALAAELRLQSSIVGAIESEEDVLTAIEKIVDSQSNALNNQITKSKVLQENFNDIYTNTQAELLLHKSKMDLLSGMAEITDKIANSTNAMVDSLKSTIEDIPLLGKSLSSLIPFDNISEKINTAAGAFKEGFTSSFTDANIKSDGFAKSFTGGISSGLKSMTGGVSSFAAALTSPLVIIGAIVALFALGVVRLIQVDKALHHVKDSTGLVKSQLDGVSSQISSVHATTADLGASFDDIANGIADFSNEFDGIELASEATLTSMITLNKNLGIGTTESAKLNKIFQNIGGLTQEQSQALIGQTAVMAKMAGVAPSKVIEDMANNSEYAYKFFQKNPKALASAAIQARKLGTSIGEAGKVAEGLLDFESSITDEIEASAMLGTNLNFAKSRQLAYDGKLVESQQAILAEVEKKVDLNNIDIFQQEALAKATNMSMEDLTNQIRIRKQISKYNAADQKHAQELLSAGIDITNMSAEDLNKQTEKLHSQKEMQTSIEKLMDMFKGIGSSMMDALMPLGKLLIGILIPAFYAIKQSLMVILGVFKLIGGIIDWVLIKPIVFMYEQFMKFSGILKERLQPAFDRIKEAGSRIVHAFQPLFDMFAGSGGGGFTKVLGMVGDILGTVILGAIDLIVWGVENIVSVFEMMVGFVEIVGAGITKYIVEPVMAVVDAFSSIGSYLGFGGTTVAQPQVQEHINDGIVQNGKVITTNPSDTILATKSPGSMMGGNNDKLISKINELIVAVKSNKDVYIDKQKVTNTIVKSSEKQTENLFGLGVA